MASSPKFKVYTESYMASCHELEAAIILSDWYGRGSVRYGHRHVIYSPSNQHLSIDEKVEAAFDILETKFGVFGWGRRS